MSLLKFIFLSTVITFLSFCTHSKMALANVANSSHIKTESKTMILMKINEDDDAKLLSFENSKQIFSLRHDHPQFNKIYSELTKSKHSKKPIVVVFDTDLNIINIK